MDVISTRTKLLRNGCFSVSSAQYFGMQIRYTKRFGKKELFQRLGGWHAHRLMSVFGLGHRRCTLSNAIEAPIPAARPDLRSQKKSEKENYRECG